jgi:proteasome lid subunit RPN8/RPN11
VVFNDTSYLALKEDEMGRACRRRERHACGILVGKPEGQTTLRRPRRRLKHNIKMDFGDI